MSCFVFYKFAVGLKHGLITASEPGAGTPAHAPVHNGECLSDGGHQAGLYAIGMSTGMFLKFAPDKIAHQHEIEPVLDVLWPNN